MRLYRIGGAAYAERLDGTGAAIRGARWNPPMVPMLYTADSPALAMLETLAHFGDRSTLPVDTVLITLELAGRSGMKYPSRSSLPMGWDMPGPPYPVAAQAFGERFIGSRAVALRVPSVLLRGGWNYLLNPRTIAGRVRVIGIAPVRYDTRFRPLLGS